MSISSEINSLVKIKKIKKELDTLPTPAPISTQKGYSSGSGTDEVTSGLVGPLALEILTYDDTVDIDFKDTSDTTHTLKTAATAKIIDANGDEYIIETITYADP